ncbi:A24 family peptidase [Vibrio natriegens]|uniref:A24 family peptidase n=1 Tax=Vibrio natriegens TaxID=691 RepID=UPI001FBA174C|nr:prepilin peptidase [Vibrio natriegens]
MASNSFLLLQIITVFLLLVIALNDVFQRKVPNICLLLLLFVGVTFTPFYLHSFLAGIAIVVFGLVAFHYRWLGAGDSKLLAICAYASLEQWYWLLLKTALLGGVLSVAYLLFNHFAIRGVIAAKPRTTVPYAVAICIAATTTIHYM